ncbi:MAG TPA: hypothetical protein VHU41_15095 [Thermoanaerobaculia bacterium]|jgi:hypothetical protein|nr:hypothetical protein [Thermoanaerobaculia bacterium]
MKTKDAEAVLELVGKISTAFEATMTDEERAAKLQLPRDESSTTLVYSTEQREDAYEDFAAVTAMEALASMADEIDRVIAARMEKLYGDCLAIYYALEDLAAKDPENETYMEHMREMETAHMSQYGRPIPPRA